MLLSNDPILVAVNDDQMFLILERVLLGMGQTIKPVENRQVLFSVLSRGAATMVIIGTEFDQHSGLKITEEIRQNWPGLPVVLFVPHPEVPTLLRAIRAGIDDVFSLPVSSSEIRQVVEHCLELNRRTRDHTMGGANEPTMLLHGRTDDLEVLLNLCGRLFGSQDTDVIVAEIVSAAVELSGAEESSLFLIDPKTERLLLRAQRNSDEAQARLMHKSSSDSAVGEVVRTGKAFVYDSVSPMRLATGILSQALAYIPMVEGQTVTGVLGVNNRRRRIAFTSYQMRLLNTLVRLGMIALKNCAAHAEVRTSNSLYQIVIENLAEGLVVLDHQNRVVMVNQQLRDLMGFAETQLTGRPLLDFLVDSQARESFTRVLKDVQDPQEVVCPHGRTCSLRRISLPDNGNALVLTPVEGS